MMKDTNRGVSFTTMVGCLVLILAASVQARLPEPDHIIYGAVTQFGSPVSDGTQITIVLAGQTEPVASYRIGDDPTLNGLFALRIPMDSVDPRVDGTARPGELADIYVAEQLVARTAIGEQGTAVRLDLDPDNLTGFPNLTIGSATVTEGNGGGFSGVSLPVELSTTTGADIIVSWRSVDGTAVAGVCREGGDYVAASGDITIPSGSLSASIDLTVCRDEDRESNEAFTVEITSAPNTNIVVGEAVVTILDDDTIPSLSIADAVVIEPPADPTQAELIVTLSQASGTDVSFSYTTSAGTADENVDFTPTAGQVTIPAGNPIARLTVPVLPDSTPESDETFFVTLSLPANATIADGEAVAVIIDPTFDPTILPDDGLQDGDGGVDGLSGAAALVLPTGGAQVYVAANIDDSVAEFNRSAADGSVAFDAVYDDTTTGFDAAQLDAASDITASADGQFLFVAANAPAPANGAINVLQRDDVTGTLTFLSTTDANLQTMDGVRGLAVSPDGEHLYAAARDSGVVNVLTIEDSPTPAMAFVEATTGDGLQGAQDIAISADGLHVYVTATIDNRVSHFSRNSTTGALTFMQSYRDNIAGVEGLVGAHSVLISPDQQHVYVTGNTENTLVIFDRAADGSLTYREHLSGGQGNLFAMRGPTKLALTSDGRALAVIGVADNSITVFERQHSALLPNFGGLQATDVLRDGDAGITLMAGPSDLKFSADSFYLYVTASVDNALLVFRRARADVLFSSGFEG